MRASKLLLTAGLFCLILITTVAPLHAQDQINYTSQPDEIAIFLNDIAYVRDTITLPGNTAVQVVLPPQTFPDTLIARENGERIPYYRIFRENNLLLLTWDSTTREDIREVTLEYLMSGISWSPKYDMWLSNDVTAPVEFHFFAQINNNILNLQNVETRLIAGRVDTSQALTEVSTATANQFAAGYEDRGVGGPSIAGQASIQHVYDIAPLTAQPGNVIYLNLTQNILQARRVLLWNATTDRQVTVIYKIRNESDIPFAEGIVRTYQNDLFLGSDFIELTPVSSEGSVTVGRLQNVRVNRTETQTSVTGAYDRDTLHDVEMTLTNFDSIPLEIEVIDRFRPGAVEFTFVEEPEREGDNILRWTITIEAGETVTINYQFKD